jgi:hypothetical protein
MTPRQETEIGDLVCNILHSIYVQHKARFRREAARCHAAVEQLAAAAITEALRELLELPTAPHLHN